MRWRLLLGMVLTAVAALLLQRRVNVERAAYLEAEEERPFVPPLPEVVRLMALGYENLVADVYWIGTIQYYENAWDHHRKPRDLYAMTNFLTDVDPHYCMAYFYAGLALMNNHMDSRDFIALLTKGSSDDSCPTSWRNPFLLSYYYIFELQDFQSAAPWMRRACILHQGHKLYCSLATRLESITGEPEEGIALLRETMASNDDPTANYVFSQRLQELEAKIIERDLTAAVKRYAERHGAPPTRLSDLFAEGPVIGTPPAQYQALKYSSLPPHPMVDHHFIFDRDAGVVRSDPPLNLGLNVNPQMGH